MKSFPLLVCSAALLSAPAVQAVTFDFSTADQLTDNFSRRSSSSVTQGAGVLEYNITTGTSTAAAVYTVGSWTGPGGTGVFTPTAYTLSETPLVVSMDIAPSSALVTTQNTAFGLYISDASNVANNMLFSFNVDLSGGADTFRVWADGNITGASNSKLRNTEAFSTNVMSPGAALAPVSFSITQSQVTLTVGGQSVSASLLGSDLNWSSSNISFRAVDGSNSGANLTTGLLQMDNFSISTVPEPSSYAAFAGLVALTGVAVHRRRKRQ